jgi:hypothetical protein
LSALVAEAEWQLAQFALNPAETATGFGDVHKAMGAPEELEELLDELEELEELEDLEELDELDELDERLDELIELEELDATDELDELLDEPDELDEPLELEELVLDKLALLDEVIDEALDELLLNELEELAALLELLTLIAALPVGLSASGALSQPASSEMLISNNAQ